MAQRYGIVKVSTGICNYSKVPWIFPKRCWVTKPGRNDPFMSVYLPYCDKFVTADGEQEKSLRELAVLTGVETEILSYEDFCDSFLVAL